MREPCTQDSYVLTTITIIKQTITTVALVCLVDSWLGFFFGQIFKSFGAFDKNLPKSFGHSATGEFFLSA